MNGANKYGRLSARKAYLVDGWEQVDYQAETLKSLLDQINDGETAANLWQLQWHIHSIPTRELRRFVLLQCEK